ncbi:hypothetical protein PYW07_016010 [Mythimna separata]|uniref:FP protein C-terminal domain-containing protein n=1 Tax=Mythimna separata TaxID=271217 RepID=A0AAD8DUW5_MYTSE|nr:hypothetical protein PYW07_016010 [Mythimna separata]
MRRTPPPGMSSAASTASDSETTRTSNTAINLSGSYPNLSSMDGVNVPSRNLKRKYDNELPNFMQEIRDLLEESKAQSEIKFTALQKSMTEIIAQNTELKKSIEFMNKQYDDIKIRLDNTERDRKVDRTYINQLEDKVENLERILCLSKIEIRNIPRKEGESKEDLRNIVSDTAKVLDINVERHEVKDIFRVNKKGGGSSVIADFVSVSMKENILQKVRSYNRKNTQARLNTAHINIPGDIKPIYLSECLTMKSQRLFFLARKFASENNFKFCWTSLGKVFLRQKEGSQHILIKSEDDLKSSVKP